MNSNYLDSSYYEDFIMNARKCKREEFGAHNKNMELLMDYEQGKIAPIFTKSRLNKLLPDVKRNMKEAIKFTLTRADINSTDKAVLKSYLPKIGSSNKSDELLLICKEGLDVLRKYISN